MSPAGFPTIANSAHSPQPNLQSSVASAKFSLRFLVCRRFDGYLRRFLRRPLDEVVTRGTTRRLVVPRPAVFWRPSSAARQAGECSCCFVPACWSVSFGGCCASCQARMAVNYRKRSGFRSGKFSTTSTIVRSLLSIVIVGMGASLGREGALKQTGAAIAARLAAWAGLPASQMRLLAAYGAGVGMAAAYNVPCGGALFALEVLLGRAVPTIGRACSGHILHCHRGLVVALAEPVFLFDSYLFDFPHTNCVVAGCGTVVWLGIGALDQKCCNGPSQSVKFCGANSRAGWLLSFRNCSATAKTLFRPP
jgi:hypothetical protein